MIDSVGFVVTDSYLETALWSSTDNDGNRFDSEYDARDVETASYESARGDCEHFIGMLEQYKLPSDSGYANLYEAAESLQSDGRIGHDFWLTRNGHGAGFWDGDYGEYGDILTEIVETNFSECDLYVGDDLKIHIM